MKKNVWQMLDSYLCLQEDLEKDNGHSLVLVLRKVVLLSVRTVHKELGQLQKGCWRNSPKADVQFSGQRLHCPEVNSKVKDTENCRFTIAADQETIETIFRIIVSANQLSLYGAVAEICEEYESLHEKMGRPVLMGQSSSSLVLSAIKTEVPLDNDDPAYKTFSCNNLKNELRSCHNKTN